MTYPTPSHTTHDDFTLTTPRTKRAYATHIQEIRRRTDLSDGAKLTYFELLDYDFQDAYSGECKGFVWPSVATLATARGKSERTIREHLQEIAQRGLIARTRRRNTPSVFHLQQPSQARTETHRAIGEASRQTSTEVMCETAKNCRSSSINSSLTRQSHTRAQWPKRERQKIAIAYKEETTRTEKLQQANAVVEKLERLHIATTTAQRLTQQFERGYIEEKIRLLEHRLARTGFGTPIQHPGAWLIRAIECDYQSGERTAPPAPAHMLCSENIEIDEQRGVVIFHERRREEQDTTDPFQYVTTD
jgi:hypothetical protein